MATKSWAGPSGLGWLLLFLAIGSIYSIFHEKFMPDLIQHFGYLLICLATAALPLLVKMGISLGKNLNIEWSLSSEIEKKTYKDFYAPTMLAMLLLSLPLYFAIRGWAVYPNLKSLLTHSKYNIFALGFMLIMQLILFWWQIKSIKRILYLLALSYAFAISLASILFFILALFQNPDDFAYSIMAFFLLIPISAFLSGILYGGYWLWHVHLTRMHRQER